STSAAPKRAFHGSTAISRSGTGPWYRPAIRSWALALRYRVFIHTVFDLLAVVAAIGAFYFLPLPSSAPPPPLRLHPAYLSFASLGMMAGAIAAGTANLFLSGYPEVGKSVLGGLAGAIFAVEMTKRRLGVTGSTGLRFAAPLAVGIVVGRLGCFFAGMEDRTYGSPPRLPWGRGFRGPLPPPPGPPSEAFT